MGKAVFGKPRKVKIGYSLRPILLDVKLSTTSHISL